MENNKKRIKVAFNLISFNDTKAVGTFVFMRRLFQQMQECDLSKFNFIVYVQKHINIKDFHLPDNCPVEIVRIPRLESPIKRILFEQTLFYFYTKKTDILYTPSLSMPFFSRATKIQTIHDMIPFILPQKYGRFKLWYIKNMIKCVIKVSKHIVTVSSNSKSDIINICKTNPDKISIIYNFIFKGEEVIKRDSLNFDPVVKSFDGTPIEIKTPCFLTVATLQPAKNVEGLIKAFNKFNEKNVGYYLYIVGNKGWNYNKIFKEVEDLGLTEKVIFTGYMDDFNLSKLYEISLGILYFTFYEGFGLPPLEGFHHDKACVASNTSSIPEVVGKAGILVDPYDIDSMAEGIEQFLLNHEKLEEKISGQIEKFNPAVQAENLLNLFIKFAK